MAEIPKYEPPAKLSAGQIQFIEACHPPLTAAEYKVTVSQNIRASEGGANWHDPYQSEMSFEVDAPRFTLNPADIYSVYPPIDEKGQFDNVLPHVVFTRRTLPWERTRDGAPPTPGQKHDPWLGLLLFTEEELRVPGKDSQRYEPRSLPVFSETEDSLLKASDPAVLVPDVGQKAASKQAEKDRWAKAKWRYETAPGGSNKGKKQQDALCLAIDLPADRFHVAAPRPADLAYLAHVRRVDTGDKEVFGVNDKGWFSLIICNRLPAPDGPHRAFLIAIEGLQDYLEDGWTPVPGQRVRVAVLGTWAFSCTKSNSFKDILDHVNFDRETDPGTRGDREKLPDSWLRLPQPSSEGSSDAARVVTAAYSFGYSAFDHLMRQGEKTVSWYRGPLVPAEYTKPEQIQEPVACADELLRYDPETGLFDVTYAAAWQLGRLLALQNQSFALALDRTRRMLRTRAEQQIRQSELDGQGTQDLKLQAGKGDLEDDLLQCLAKVDW